MAQAEVNSPPFVPNHSLSHLSSPIAKRSRLSLRRTTQILHKPCYKEDDVFENKNDPSDEIPSDKSNVEMIDLTQDENASPNCLSSSEEKLGYSTLLKDEDNNEVKVSTLGLPNCGNTCYVNSILQVLRFTPEFLSSLHSLLLIKHHLSRLFSRNCDETKELLFFKQLHLLYTAMKRREASMKTNSDRDYCSFLMKPVKSVINSLREVSLLFEEGEQNDAHELLITTISAFSTARQSLKTLIKSSDSDSSHGESSPARDSETGPSTLSDDIVDTGTNEELLTPKKRRSRASAFNYSLIDSLNLGFEGKIRHVVQCLECEKRLEKEESFANLEVSIPEISSTEESVDLQQCLSQTTILSGENKFFCEECQHYNEARMSSEVVQLPPILLLHCSWLKSSEASAAEKTSVKVVIPRTLATSENADVFPCDPGQVYKLFAVVLHIGLSTQGGHYVSFIRDASAAPPPGRPDAFAPKLRAATQFIAEASHCCATEQVAAFAAAASSGTRWLLFDDNVVSPVVVDEEPETFPYFDFLTVNASPCMIFYHRT